MSRIQEAIRLGFITAKKIYRELGAGRNLSDQHLLKAEEFLRELWDCTQTLEPDVRHFHSQQIEPQAWLYNHWVNVAALVTWYTQRKSISLENAYPLLLGAYLHDIGYARIDEGILNSRHKLDENSRLQMQMHTQFGYNFVKDMKDIDDTVKQAILFHHERFDGEGYPTTLPYDRLPLSLKIVGMADVLEALLHERTYRKAYPLPEALRLLFNMGNHEFDPALLRDFLGRVGRPLALNLPFYRGGQLGRLSSGALVSIEEAHSADWLHPTVMVLINEKREIVPRSEAQVLPEELTFVYSHAESEKIRDQISRKRSQLKKNG